MPQIPELLIEKLHHDLHSYAGNLCENIRPLYINRIVPRRTLSLSVTGSKCLQNCSHCNGHYLKGMTAFNKLETVDFSSYDSVLISGGGDQNGAVNISDKAQMILNLPSHLTLNIHPGYQQASALDFLGSRKTVVSFDLPTSDRVIKEVFRLKHSVEDYQKLFLEYRHRFTTIPHITIGLDSPDCTSEIETIDFLSKHSIKELVFIVFRPTPGTELENQPLPDIQKAIDCIDYAIKRLDARILLGCMRPSGEYRKNFDILAWLSGIRDFVQPDHDLLRILEESGCEIRQKARCCAL